MRLWSLHASHYVWRHPPLVTREGCFLESWRPSRTVCCYKVHNCQTRVLKLAMPVSDASHSCTGLNFLTATSVTG